MSAFVRLHHQYIIQALKNFNTEFMVTNNILFGGGTRIALDINEFRGQKRLQLMVQQLQIVA